jgi:hypothetical protein
MDGFRHIGSKASEMKRRDHGCPIKRRRSMAAQSCRTSHGAEPALPGQAIAALRSGIATLKTPPFMCRNDAPSPFLRDLIAPFGRSGQVALFEIEDDDHGHRALRLQRAGGEIDDTADVVSVDPECSK